VNIIMINLIDTVHQCTVSIKLNIESTPESTRACLQSTFQDRKAAYFESFRAQTRNPAAKYPLDSRFHGNDNGRFCAFCPNVNTP